MNTAAIETKELCIGYRLKGGRTQIVHDHLNLHLVSGEVTCLLGLNGAGKSTLLRTLCGFQPALGGEIRLLGRPLAHYSQTEFARTVGVVLTEKTHAGGLTVFELASLGRYPYTGFFGKLTQSDRQIVRDSLEAVGIAHKSANYVAELSDGERQKVMIAKVLSQQCPLILLDEPTAFLDVTSRLETMLLLHRLAAEQHKTVLLSTHDLDLAIQLADNLWMQAKERPLLCGAPEDLILSGTFGSFFEKTGISFNETTGKLNAETQAIPICVTGDTTVVYWVSNALARNGFCASSTVDGDFRIDCRSANELRISFPDGNETVCPHIVELTRQLRDFFPGRKQKFPRQETEIPSAGKNFSSGKKNKR